GSGKTLLALDFAVTLASSGKRVLLLCFNRNLAAWLSEQKAGDLRLTPSAGVFEIATFHSFALTLARRTGIEFEVPPDNPQPFWDDEAPLLLEQALEVLRARGTPLAFDAVVVDEGQDFAPDWWVTVESLTRDGRDGRLYAFLDLNQSVRGVAGLPPVPFQARFRLTTNCRNTKSIARSGAALARVEANLRASAPEGEEPATRRARSEAADAGLVLAEVRRLLLQGILARQIALIGPSAHDKGVLRAHAEVDGMPLITDAT